jgi:hypothetical protein
MKQSSFSIIFLLLVTFVSANCQASLRGKRNVAPSGDYSFELVSNGRVLPVYNHDGKSYVEGIYGQTYGIRVNNHTGRRIEAVVTVDGRDVVSGKRGNYRTERGYVIEPYNSVLIDGFRRSWTNVAAFTFTHVSDSYAARVGDASNVGVVGVAVFKEKHYRPRPRPVLPYAREESRDGAGSNMGSGYGGSSAKKSRSAPPSSAYESESSVDDYEQGLGTRYGDDTYSPSTRTTFTRASRRPTAVMAVRYDDREGLYRLGVLPRPRRYRYSDPEPFPNSPEPVRFAPPPPRQWWE